MFALTQNVHVRQETSRNSCPDFFYGAYVYVGAEATYQAFELSGFKIRTRNLRLAHRAVCLTRDPVSKHFLPQISSWLDLYNLIWSI